ncbi:ATP-binding protein [Bdellovibrionota bacterium FG-1]
MSRDLIGPLTDQQKDLSASRKMWISRDIHADFEKTMNSSLIKVIMGIRRAGKSTLCTQVGPDSAIAYCNFDDERLAAITSEDLNAIYETLLQIKPQAKFFVFDEIQNVEHWELFINRLKRKGLNILVTGSNGKLLSLELATHLTGRQLTIELMPFSFGEYLCFQGIPLPASLSQVSTEERAEILRHFQWYFENGGFPEVVSGEHPGPYLRELFDKIVSRDIAQRHEIRTPRMIKQLGLFLIQQSGSLTSLKKTLVSFQYRSVNTLRAHISYIQDSYLLYEVCAYSHKIRERSTSPKKNYACDTGMMAALHTKPTPDWGMRFETLVFLQLRRTYPEIFYAKGPDYDVDFAITQDRKISRLIQVCYDLNAPETLERELRSLICAAKKFPNARLQLITRNDERIIEQEGIKIEIVPGWKFCLT